MRTGIGLVPFINEQMELGALGKLQLRSKRASGRLHTGFLSPILPSKRDTRLGGSRRWHRIDWLQRTQLQFSRLFIKVTSTRRQRS